MKKGKKGKKGRLIHRLSIYALKNINLIEQGDHRRQHEWGDTSHMEQVLIAVEMAMIILLSCFFFFHCHLWSVINSSKKHNRNLFLYLFFVGCPEHNP